MAKYEFYLPPIRDWGPRWWSAYKMLAAWAFSWAWSLRRDVPWEKS